MESNPIPVPDIYEYAKKLVAFVAEHQGKINRYINTQNEKRDTIYALVRDEMTNRWVEMPIKAIRVLIPGWLQCIYDVPQIKWDDYSLMTAEDSDWSDVLYDDEEILSIPTILNIGEYLYEYV